MSIRRRGAHEGPVHTNPLQGRRPGEWERIVVVRLDNAGDVLLVSPALRALRHMAPQASIALMCSRAGAAAGRLIPEVDRIMIERVPWQEIGDRAASADLEQERIERIATGRFDAAIILTSWAQSPWAAAYACLLAGVPVRVGRSGEFGGNVLTHRAPVLPDEVHQVDRNLATVDWLALEFGIEPAPVRRDEPESTRLVIRTPPGTDEAADRLLAGAGIAADRPYLLVAPGASCSARRYPAASFAAAAHRLHAATAWPVVVVGDDSDAVAAATIAGRIGRAAVDLCGRTDLATATSVIARASVALTNDSAPMHLAEAVGTPQVVLYSGTELESQWAPRWSPARILRVPTTCTPCHRLECPHGLVCLDVDPAVVAGAALGLLERHEPGLPPGVTTTSTGNDTTCAHSTS